MLFLHPEAVSNRGNRPPRRSCRPTKPPFHTFAHYLWICSDYSTRTAHYFLALGVLPAPNGHPFRASGVESALIALTIFNAAFIAETVRGDIASVRKRQVDAELQLGLTRSRALYCVVLPQVVRQLYAPLVGRFVNLLLGTSMVSIVGVSELTRTAVIVNSNEMQHSAAIFGFVGAVYFLICFPLTFYLGRLHERARTVAPEATNLASRNSAHFECDPPHADTTQERHTCLADAQVSVNCRTPSHRPVDAQPRIAYVKSLDDHLRN